MNKANANKAQAAADQFFRWAEAAGFKHQTDVARRANVDPASLGRVLKGERGMEPETAKRLAKALIVDQVEFFRVFGLLDPLPDPAPADPKHAAIERIMANLEQLDDVNLARVELLIRSYAGSIDATLPPIQGEVSLGGTLTPKHIKKQGGAA